MTKQAELDFDDRWVGELIQWANEHKIPELLYVEEELADDGTVWCEGYWTGLPRDKETLLNLEELNISARNCTDIADQIRNLKQLKVLRFRDGPTVTLPFLHEPTKHFAMEEIPDWIAELENLEVLDLSGNNIMWVPGVLGKLKNLKKLYLEGNNIMHVDDDLGKLGNLEVLHLQWNNFSALSDGIKQLKSLKELWLDGLAGSEYGPIQKCPEGLKWPANDGYAMWHINYEGQGSEEAHQMSMAEIIESGNLWM